MSATSIIEIYVPCTVLSVDVRVGPTDGLSELAGLVLEAVDAEATSFSELNSLFGLGGRVMLDLLYGLWRDGHLVLDTFRGTIALTEPTRRLLAEGRITELVLA